MVWYSIGRHDHEAVYQKNSSHEGAKVLGPEPARASSVTPLPAFELPSYGYMVNSMVSGLWSVHLSYHNPNQKESFLGIGCPQRWADLFEVAGCILKSMPWLTLALAHYLGIHLRPVMLSSQHMIMLLYRLLRGYRNEGSWERSPWLLPGFSKATRDSEIQKIICALKVVHWGFNEE